MVGINAICWTVTVLRRSLYIFIFSVMLADVRRLPWQHCCISSYGECEHCPLCWCSATLALCSMARGCHDRPVIILLVIVVAQLIAARYYTRRRLAVPMEFKVNCENTPETRGNRIWYLSRRPNCTGGSVADWLACWTQAQKSPGSNRSCDAVG